ncbi:hypothetical protein [Mesobacillus thioparans]|uniref:hypothetical protein n=1 Tax=Mesobacillus thioparans TaxID=370439 RepID=UPI0039EF7368
MDDVLTKERYIQLKHDGKTDDEVRELYKLKQTALAAFKRNNDLVGKFNTHSIRTESKEKTTTQKVEEETPNIRQEQVLEQSTDATKTEQQETRTEPTDEMKALQKEIENLKRELLEVYKMQFDTEDEMQMDLLVLRATHKEELEKCKAQQRAFEEASVKEFKEHTKYFRRFMLFSKLLKHELNKQKFNGQELDPYQEVLLEILPH